MKTKFQLSGVAKSALRISLLIICFMQLTVLTASASKNIYVRWGTDSNFNGDGGSISATGYTVANKANISPKPANTATVTFTITPTPGYLIDTVEWKNNDSNGFTIGTGTSLTPDASGNVSFTLLGNDSSFQVIFKVDPNIKTNTFIAYYGTGAIDTTMATTPDWIGGSVYRSTSATNPIGTGSYLTRTYTTDGAKTIHIVPTASPQYTIAAVQYCQAVWSDPKNITLVGTPTTVSPDGSGNFTINAVAPASYIVFVQFTQIAAQGGYIGAWSGTNNTTAYDTPVADGSGGTVWWKTTGAYSQFTNRTADFAHVTSNTDVTIEVRPATNFRITSIYYGDTTPANQVAVPVNQTTNMSFTFPVSAGHSYVVWVVFTSTAASSFTVSGTVDPTTDPLCTSNTISPASQVVNKDATGSFVLGTSSNCTIESVNFNNTGAQAWVGSGTTYTTPPITATSTFTVKFKPIGYDILAEVDSTSAGGCGSISPVGTANYIKGSSQTFTITTNTNCAISHVWVTDTNKGYTTDTDIAPLATASYTFVNLQAAGHIKVKFSAVVPTAADAYCQVPPYVAGQSTLAPNVLIVFDNSGSMGGNDSDGYAYYNVKTYDCTASSTAGSCTTFYGYFDPTKMYKVDTTDSNKYLIDNVTLNLSSTNGKSGNYLNYRNMHKVDVIRKALMGGKVVNRASSPYFLKTDNGKTVQYGTTLPSGIIQQLSGRVRFGIMVFNNPAEGGHLAKIPDGSGGWKTTPAVIGSSEADLIAAMESTQTDPLTSTPIAETLYEAIRYYQAKPSAYNSGVDYSTMDPIQNSCQKHFILLLTDGEPNSNNNLPGLSTYPQLNSYTDSVFDVTTWENRIPANDRTDNIHSTCFSTDYTGCKNSTGGSMTCTTNSEKVEAVAFYMHNTDLRSDTYGNNVDGTQNITLFPIYAFGNGTGTKTLQMAAKYGGYENKNANNPSPNTWPSPDNRNEWDHLSDTTKYDCVPYNYFESDDGAALEGSILTAMSTILAKVASGTAASILSNSEGSGANLLQAVFYPNKIFSMPASGSNPDKTAEISWIGEMQNLWYYVDPFIANSSVREDTDFTTTNPNHIFNLRNDLAARFYFDTERAETKVDLKRDTNGDGVGDVAVATEDPDLVKSIWRAGKQLWARSASTRTIHTSVDGYSLLMPTTAGGGFYAAATRATALQPYLQVADNDSNAEAMKLINYIRGTDQTGYRNRKVSIDNGGTVLTSEWKLGDIVASTPKIQSTAKLNAFNLESPAGYNDKSYNAFINTSTYKNRGMVYVGANDGMLHALKLGKLTVSGTSDAIISGTTHYTISGDTKATLTGTNLGEEQWAYIPRNALPYLKYYADAQSYKHIFYVDGPTVLSDISTGKPAGCTSTTNYSDCLKDNTGGTNWRTVLIGSMGLGGASRVKDPNTCSDVAAAAGTCCQDGMNGTCVKTPIYQPNTTDTSTYQTYANPPTYNSALGVGFSSFFALDVTNQYFNSDGTLANQPTLLWEFPPRDDANNSIGLGYATSGSTIVRVSAKKSGLAEDGVTVVQLNDRTKNGKFFAVFASGPTGPIDMTNHRFMGKSDQNLKIFVVDLGAAAPLVLNTNYWIIDTGIKRAFAGSIVGGSIDTDRWKADADGNYQDDAIYVGYAKANIADTDAISSTTTWSDGGVLRIMTKEDPNPANWSVSKVISGIGPVTSGIAKLQDRKNKKLWLYFGTGRFFYGGDDSSTQRYIMGVQDGCYTSKNALDRNCDTTASGSLPATTGKGGALSLSDLSDQTTINASDLAGKKGWYIRLDLEDTPASLAAERSITEPVALTSGMVCYTSFKPTSDVCKFGGNSYPWCVKYDNGGAVSASAKTGKILTQVSTGAFEETTISSALTLMDGRKGDVMTGKPPIDPPPIVTNSGNKPPKKLLHIQEK